MTAVPVALSGWSLREAHLAALALSKTDVPHKLFVMRRQICGSYRLRLNYYHGATFVNFPVAWTIYSFSAMCFLVHICRRHNRQLICPLLNEHSNHPSRWRPRSCSECTVLRKIWDIAASILWIASFIYMFYLYVAFNDNNFVSKEWTFGQIVSITVWVPSIVELLYMEKCKSSSFL